MVDPYLIVVSVLGAIPLCVCAILNIMILFTYLSDRKKKVVFYSRWAEKYTVQAYDKQGVIVKSGSPDYSLKFYKWEDAFRFFPIEARSFYEKNFEKNPQSKSNSE